MNLLTNPTARGVDEVLIYIFGISLLMLLGITVATLYFVIKYRRSKYPEPTSEAHGSFWLETLWTVLPTLIVLTMFWYGWTNYLGLREVPEGAMQVKATARMWSWQFTYPDGRKTNKLFVPVGKPVKVTLTSVDVLHSFFVPAFRIKRDTVPGTESYVWFEATEPGSYDIFCAEYCGTGHASMISSVEALSPEDFANWSQKQQSSGEPRGKIVMQEQGCTGCHNLDGSDGIGPNLLRLAEHERGEHFDADHIRQSVRDPNSEVAEGYQPIMPAYDEKQLSEKDLQAIIDYLLGSQQGSTQPKLDGHELLENNGCLGCHSLDGSKVVGPTFKGLAGRKVKVERDGKTLEIVADKDYLKRSILHPKADIVSGFPPIMPAGDNLSTAELDAIVDYLMQLKAQGNNGQGDHH